MFFHIFLGFLGCSGNAKLFLRGSNVPFQVTVEQLGTVFASHNAPSNFLQPVLNVSRVWPRDLEPLGGDFDYAKDATLREKQKHVPTVHPVTRGRFPQTHEERAAAFATALLLL